MLMKMIADELLADSTKDEIIDEINKAVDIPIISEKTEKAILEALWKIIKGVLLKKLGI
jgi:nucleoid DNA-binding protein|tara:strand:+ start:4220 stop:4396 length:177 start_codon:yes stop_codon:yes gene_type:complete